MKNSFLLNKKQLEAVETVNGPVLVAAGAGAGKTNVIVARIAHLIQQNNIAPEKILAVTFTNKAAEEMRERIRERFGPLGHPMSKQTWTSDVQVSPSGRQASFIGTFHALGVLIIRENLRALGINKNFTILDEEDSIKLIKECVLEQNKDPKQFEPPRIRNIISRCKNDLVGIEQFSEAAGSDSGSRFFENVAAEVWKLYEEKKKAQQLVDFDDLLLLPVLLLQKKQDILNQYTERWHYIHIDEYQDTNKAQYAISRLLAGERKNIFVVGDIDQAIYSWRGADFRNILQFQSDFSGAKVISLEENYRSTKIVLEAANAVIENNKLRIPKTLITNRVGGDKICLFCAEDEKKEARFVVCEIKNLLNAGVPLEEIAVLYRTNAQSRAIEEAFLESKLPYRVIGGTRFYERREIKDIVAYLRVIQNPKDIMSKKRVLNVPPRGIGKVLALKILGNINEFGAKEGQKRDKFEKLIKSLRNQAKYISARDIIKEIIRKTDYRAYIDDGTEKGLSRWENIRELLGVAQKFDSLDAFLEYVALHSANEANNMNKNAGVSLMTMHAAKGLEFGAVFIAGFEEGLFPHSLSFDAESMEEERRLCYVAITRAKTRLYITLAAQRLIFGERTSNMPSRFIKEIPAYLVEQFGNFENEIIIE